MASKRTAGKQLRKKGMAAFGTPVCSATVAAGIRYFRLIASSLYDSKQDEDVDGGELARSHFGLQAQDPEAALLTIFNRSRIAPAPNRTILTERYLHDANAVIRAWGQRGTLHMYAVSDWSTASVLSGRLLLGHTESSINRGPPKIENVFNKVTAEIERELAAGREVDTSIVDKHKIDDSLGRSMARRHPWIHAVRRGLGSRVTRTGKQARLVVLTPRTCEWEEPTLDDAIRTVALRYFATYAPAREQDFRYWTGLHAGESREIIKALRGEGEIVQVDELEKGWYVTNAVKERLLECMRAPPPRNEWPVRLLGRFDPYLLPHQSKEWVVAERHRPRIWTRNADILATVLIHGRVRGFWKLLRRNSSADVTVTVFEDDVGEGQLTNRERELVVVEAKRIVETHWELELDDVHFIFEGKDAGEAEEDQENVRPKRRRRK